MRNIVQTATVAVTLLIFQTLAAGQDIARSTTVANHLVELINAADYKGIQGTFDTGMHKAMPLEQTATFFKKLSTDLGKIQKLGEPIPAPQQAVIFPAHFERGILDITLVLNERNQISGLWFKPHVAGKPAPNKHKTELSLPFKGSWLVFWGGDTKELNYHHDVPNQRFAFDLLGVDASGKTRHGMNNRNEDYFAFGREVLAPADGTVIEIIDGVRDNAPGSMNPFSALGNCVVLQHREDEVSVMAHFQQGSLQVKAGDKVKRGQVLGRCGNSGNSSEPHIHYHLQHSPVIQDGLGIKPVFQKVVVTKSGQGESKERYSPSKGEIISPD